MFATNTANWAFALIVWEFALIIPVIMAGLLYQGYEEALKAR